MGWLLWPELDQANLGDDANNYGPILGPSSKEIGLKLIKIASFEVRAAAEVRTPFRRNTLGMSWVAPGVVGYPRRVFFPKLVKTNMIRPAGYEVPPGALGLVAKSVAVGATTSSIEVLWEQSGSIAASTVLENKRPATVNLLTKSTSSGGEGKDSVQGESVDHSWQGAGLASALEGLAFPPAGIQRGLLGRAGDPLLTHQYVQATLHASTPLG